MNNRETELVIDVKNLKKSFGGKEFVHGVDLQVKKGDIYGFLGPNGSGKTTTIRMICGLLTPDSGEGVCLGYNVITQSREIKKNAGYMTQKFTLYADLTVEENLDFVARLYGMSNRKIAVEEALKDLGLWERKTQLAGTLSGGWKQRLALSAALLHKPKLLLLDEPTAGVDPKARRDFWQEIHMLSDMGITTLVATHYMDEAERCTQLAFIAYGNMLAYGTPSEIVKNSNLSTWEVTGDGVDDLAVTLKNHPVFEQVVPFGNTLHVSSTQNELLDKAIKEYKQQNHFTWTPSRPSLEDVFIALIKEQPKDER